MPHGKPRLSLFQKLRRAFLSILAVEAQIQLQELDEEEAQHVGAPPEERPIYTLPLPFKSKQLDVGDSDVIELLPQMVFRVEKLVVNAPEGWTVLDVKVGNSSQFVSSGEFPAAIFAPDSVGVGLAFEPCIPGVKLSIFVRNDGKAPGFCSGVLLGQVDG